MIESPDEIKVCEEARREWAKEQEKFGNRYFYDLGLNKKYCTGIERHQDLLSEHKFQQETG